MMAGRRREELHAVVHRPALRIGGAVIEPADTGEGDRARAHGAGLERDIEVAVVEPFGAERGRSRPDRDHLGMSRRIAVGQGAIAGAGDDGAVAHDDAADRHLAPRAGGAGFVQRHSHEGSHGPLRSALLSAVLDEQDYERQQRTAQTRRAHRQGDRPRRPCLAPRGRSLDRRRPRRGQRRGDHFAGLQRDRAGQRHRRRHAAAGARAHAAVPLSQAARADDHPCRPAGPADHLPASAGRPAAPDQRRPARFQYRGAAAPHQ